MALVWVAVTAEDMRDQGIGEEAIDAYIAPDFANPDQAQALPCRARTPRSRIGQDR